MARPHFIELGSGEQIPILYEDRSVLAIDKPRGWMLVPHSWQKTDRNLQAAITSSIASGQFWARSRNLKFLRHIHRLDAGTSGILLFAKSRGALDTYGNLFESRKMEKIYWAVAHGLPKQTDWTCRLKLGPDPRQIGRMKVSPRDGKDAETRFRVLQIRSASAPAHPNDSVVLIEARPVTGRTHQIRVHLAQCGHPVAGDDLYGSSKPVREAKAPAQHLLGLRAVSLSYVDPFDKRPVRIAAPSDAFLREYGFKVPQDLHA